MHQRDSDPPLQPVVEEVLSAARKIVGVVHEYRDGKIAKESIYYAAPDTYDQLTRSSFAE